MNKEGNTSVTCFAAASLKADLCGNLMLFVKAQLL